MMKYDGFFPPPKTLSVAELISMTGATPLNDFIDAEIKISSIAPLDTATSGEVSFLDNQKYAHLAAETKASVCFTSPRNKDLFSEHVVVLVCPNPYEAFASVGAALYPDALKLQLVLSTGVSEKATLGDDVSLGQGVTIEAGAVIGANVQLGNNVYIGPNAVIGAGVRIGHESQIGANCSIQHAYIGDLVIIHNGCAIGQDGFGFAMSPKGHTKVVQVGRVIIQNHVEIGANSTVDRGANRDTIIGEGTKIDNQVQIAHNVQIGRHCVIAAQVGVAGSTQIGDFVAIGGQAGIIGHTTIGDGAQIAASSAVKDAVPRGGIWGGIPAKPLRELARELATISRLSKKKDKDV